MADFCKECSERVFGEDFGDFKGIAKNGECASVLCEGCGIWIIVDHNGKRMKEEEKTKREDND